MDKVTTVGLDIAKSVFQVHGVDAVGEVVMRRKLTRGRVLGFCEMSRSDRLESFTKTSHGTIPLSIQE